VAHSTQGVTRILKPRERENARLPVTKNPRSGNYVQETIHGAERQSPLVERPGESRAVSFADESRTHSEVRENESDTEMNETIVVETVDRRPDAASSSAPKRGRVAMHGDPPVVGKEKLSKVLGRMNGPEKLANLLLNQRVENVTVQGILSGSADVRRILFSKKEWEYDEDRDAVSATGPLNRVSAVRMDEPSALTGYKSVKYQTSCPVLHVETRLGMKEALLDTGAEVNVMSRAMAEALELPIDRPPLVHGISFDGATQRFTGVIRELDVKVLDVVVTVHMFVAEVVDPKYSMILGNPYLSGARAEIHRDGEGNCLVRLFDQRTGKSAKVQAAVARIEDDDSMEEMIHLAKTQLNGRAG